MDYCSDYVDFDVTSEKSNSTSEENRRHNHSEVEKRRRDKMNTYINELASIIPMCYAQHRKLDKLTVLRMAVQHLRSMRVNQNAHGGSDHRPSFLSEPELKMLIQQAAEGFVFVVGCDGGRILYVSETVFEILNCSPSDLVGQCWFDVLDPNDVAKMKEQLSSMDPCPRQRSSDQQKATDSPQNQYLLSAGARRSFFCRMKLKPSSVKEEFSDHKYRVIQCLGYLKSLALNNDDEQMGNSNDQGPNLSCLVTIGRIPPNVLLLKEPSSLDSRPNIKQVVFLSRHSIDGKFLFIEQRATLVIGFLSQDILGTSIYEYVHHEDVTTLTNLHTMVLQMMESLTTPVYRFRSKDNGFIQIQSEWKAFKNPWTKNIDFISAKNYVFL